MYTAGELAEIGIGLTVIGATFGLYGGLRGALRVGRTIFFSFGLFMLFSAWLQFINFDGNWPKDQPPIADFSASKAQVKRLDDAKGDPMSTQDWDDYHRCKKLNVCIRKFQGLRATQGKSVEPLAPPTTQPVVETRCVVTNGVLNCYEFLRR